MKCNLIIPLIFLFILYSSFSAQIGQQGSINVNAPQVLSSTAKAVKDQGAKNNNSIKAVLDRIEQICSYSIIDTSQYNIDTLLDESLKTDVPDNDLAVRSSINNEYMLEIAFNELCFRLFNSIQKHQEVLFSNLSSTEKLATIPVFVTTNTDIAQKKTLLFRRQIWILTLTEKKEERMRCWLAVKRMLDEIDIPKSETGDPVVQKSPYGIMISKGEVIPKLRTISQNETDEDVKVYSAGLVKAIESAGPRYKESSAIIALNELENYDPAKSKVNKTALKVFGEASGTGNREEKISFYTVAIRIDSTFTAAYYNRAVCLYDAKNYTAAAKDFQKVVELDQGYYTSYKFLGNINYVTGNYKEAAKNFTEALKYDVSDTLFLCRGLSYQKSKHYGQAANDYSAVIKLNPDMMEAYKNRAQCYLALESYDNALKDFKKLIRLEPGNSTYYYNMGFVYSMKSDWDKVVESWEKGLAVNPGDVNIKKNLPAAKANQSKQKGKK